MQKNVGRLLRTVTADVYLGVGIAGGSADESQWTGLTSRAEGDGIAHHQNSTSRRTFEG